MVRPLMLLAAIAALAAPALAQDAVRNERIQFARGASSATVTGDIQGYDTVNHLVGARAGQTMSVHMRSSNASNYFNVTAPGADAALFTGSSDGQHFEAQLPSSGDYVVQVYLMRNAARRGESANYTLTVDVR
ncbi:DNA breaking-rejoining protein [Brevundimonas lenta]|uniref:DNA breaking-rejoining protein n=1 Tax=Brevundimonas lenta TaxID=424796 RepID=A0A7W6JA32_9CAUL|nr:DNA breaking-rejoining protein [Brevundimonas lenta]MBB4081340.1 hypothetical protein [Brevundimonas lenta]